MLAWAATDDVIAKRIAAVAIALSLGAAGGIGLFPLGRELRGTTLVAPWRWACFSFAALVVGELCVAWLSVDTSPAFAAHARYLAGATTLAPFVALLGAKRPQDRGWQWIVLALLLMLALPSGKALVFDSGAPPAPHAAWRLLLAVLLASQFANHAPTRFWPSALLAGMAQLAWLVGYLPGVANPPFRHLPWAGLALATAAVWLVRYTSTRQRQPHRPIDLVWLDFRDAYGALWALRVADRFNASALMYGWPARLGWGGMREEGGGGQVRPNDVGGPDVTAAMQQNLKTLLWRFVSPE
jgi:hypothetical protein